MSTIENPNDPDRPQAYVKSNARGVWLIVTTRERIYEMAAPTLQPVVDLCRQVHKPWSLALYPPSFYGRTRIEEVMCNLCGTHHFVETPT